MSGRLNGPLAMVFGVGWIGVDLFFVLSGFLITGILYDTKGSEGYFRNFYARRTLRILPLYYGFLFIAIVLPRLGCSLSPWIDRYDVVSLGLYVFNFRVAFTQHDLAVVGHFWSLSVEEHFYSLWPFVVWSLRRRSLMRLCVGVAAVSFLLRVVLVLSGAPPRVEGSLTPCRLDGLLFGSFVALARRDQSDWAEVRRWSKRVLWGTGWFLFGLALGQRHFLGDAGPRRGQGLVDGKLVLTLGISVLSVFFSSLIVETVDAPEEGSHLRRFLEGNTLRAIGKYSYAMYVFHLLIQTATVQLLSPLMDLPAYIAKPLAVICVTAVSFAAAWLSYHLYEKHFLRLKRFFEYRAPAHLATPVSSQYPSYQMPDPLQAGC